MKLPFALVVLSIGLGSLLATDAPYHVPSGTIPTYDSEDGYAYASDDSSSDGSTTRLTSDRTPSRVGKGKGKGSTSSASAPSSASRSKGGKGKGYQSSSSDDLELSPSMDTGSNSTGKGGKGGKGKGSSSPNISPHSSSPSEAPTTTSEAPYEAPVWLPPVVSPTTDPPTKSPSATPSLRPSTNSPMTVPTTRPSTAPPTDQPTDQPTASPTNPPTGEPSASLTEDDLDCPNIAGDTIRGYPLQATVREFPTNNNNTGGQWGWYLEFIYTENEFLSTWDLYAGAGGNDLTVGTRVGTAQVVVVECDENDEGESFVNYELPADAAVCVDNGGPEQEETHIYYELPKQLGAPGQYTNRCCRLQEPCFVILHTTVVDYKCPPPGQLCTGGVAP